MNKKERAKIEIMCREIGYNEKQIKTIIKRAEKYNLTVLNLLAGFTCAWVVNIARTWLATVLAYLMLAYSKMRGSKRW